MTVLQIFIRYGSLYAYFGDILCRVSYVWRSLSILNRIQNRRRSIQLLILLLPLALQPAVCFGLSNNTSPFFPIYHQLSPSSHSQHLKIYFHFFSPSFLGLPLRLVPSSFWVKICLGILSSSILSRWHNLLILCPFIHFTIFSPLRNSSSSRFVLLFHSPPSYLVFYNVLHQYVAFTRGINWQSLGTFQRAKLCWKTRSDG